LPEPATALVPGGPAVGGHGSSPRMPWAVV
jgi:hypothetical protein